MRNTPPRKGDHSPWGTIQQVKALAEGICLVSTAGHGGIWLSPERVAVLKAAIPAFKPWTGDLQWLEEDADQLVAALLFPESLEPQRRGTVEELVRAGCCGSVNSACVNAYLDKLEAKAATAPSGWERVEV